MPCARHSRKARRCGRYCRHSSQRALPRVSPLQGAARAMAARCVRHVAEHAPRLCCPSVLGFFHQQSACWCEQSSVLLHELTPSTMSSSRQHPLGCKSSPAPRGRLSPPLACYMVHWHLGSLCWTAERRAEVDILLAEASAENTTHRLALPACVRLAGGAAAPGRTAAAARRHLAPAHGAPQSSRRRAPRSQPATSNAAKRQDGSRALAITCVRPVAHIIRLHNRLELVGCVVLVAPAPSSTWVRHKAAGNPTAVGARCTIKDRRTCTRAAGRRAFWARAGRHSPVPVWMVLECEQPVPFLQLIRGECARQAKHRVMRRGHRHRDARCASPSRPAPSTLLLAAVRRARAQCACVGAVHQGSAPSWRGVAGGASCLPPPLQQQLLSAPSLSSRDVCFRGFSDQETRRSDEGFVSLCSYPAWWGWQGAVNPRRGVRA